MIDHTPKASPSPDRLPASPTWRRKLIWTLWLITWLGLLGGLVQRQWYEVVVYCSGAHALLFIGLERFHPLAFPVQVRLAYVVWVAIGTYVPHMQIFMYITTVGLATNLFWGYCPLARMLSLLPWNRQEPFSLDLLRRVVLTPPVKGRFRPMASPSNH